MITWLAIACQPGSSDSEAEAAPEQTERKIVSLSGFLTETLFDLGLGDQIVGRDITSTYPDTVKHIPALGHVARINVEAVLSMAPDLVILEEDQVGQSPAIQQIQNSGIEVLSIPTGPYLANALGAAKTLSEHLPVEAEAISAMSAQIERDSLALAQALAQFTDTPSVLFIYARGAGRLMVGGKETGASSMIQKAGGKNAIQSFDQYEALTPEYLLEAKPDVILMFTSGLASLDGKDGLTQIKGIDQTPAYQNDRIVAMDGHYLVSFSSRAGQAALELAQQIHAK
ncbi:MAG: ABC transporter substrate-binding protein [Bacteroidota bacterium]